MASLTAPTISATGVTAPTFAQILAFLQTQFQAIYGADVYLGNDSQDGQFLGVLAQAISDSNAALIAAYNAFSPATAQGNSLSSVVKINGIARAVPTNSQVDVLIVGQAGAVITNGVVQDTNGNKWNLPASVVIPLAGQITVTTTAQVAGAVTAAANTVTKIVTPAFGWQTVNNPLAATAGAPVETDAALRVRQGTSVALPSQTVLEALVGTVANLPGVTRYAAYENDTNATDANGVPPHSLALVVENGTAQAIAQAISNKKSPGAGTFGTTSQTVTDVFGIPHTINFFRPTTVNITATVSIKALTGYTTAVGVSIQNAVSAFINGLAIGKSVLTTRLYVPANLSGTGDGLTFEVLSVLISGTGGAVGAADVVIGFNQVAACAPAAITLAVS